MRVLLDTHALWWLFEGSEKIPKANIEIICAEENEICVSIASIWEVAIKLNIGKLEFNGGIVRFIETVEDNGFSFLGISPEHIAKTTELPLIHRDPFDRILVAQAMIEKMSIMTTDVNITKYEISVIW